VADLDLLARTAALVAIPSVSHDEAAITDHIEGALRACAHLDVERVGANLVARTHLDRSTRVILAGHTDTVPVNGNAEPRIDGDVLSGLGSADMKGGLAVMLALAESVTEPAVDVTFVFYAGEEVASEHNGLAHLARDRPDLLDGDVAILGEPTLGELEAGCQGTLRMEVVLRGQRAHTARPWMGRNAVHRLGALLRLVEGLALQAVVVSGGVAGNVVPDEARVTLNRRFAPDRTEAEAAEEVRALLAPVLEDGDELTVTDSAPAAPPGLDDPVLRALVDRHGLAVTAKLGWTDVARFAALGVPACNLGPGDPTLAHAPDERVDRASLDRAYRVLHAVLTTPPG
jgi:succinyl-diaminopimelate desuccinylase